MSTFRITETAKINRSLVTLLHLLHRSQRDISNFIKLIFMHTRVCVCVKWTHWVCIVWALQHICLLFGDIKRRHIERVFVFILFVRCDIAHYFYYDTYYFVLVISYMREKGVRTKENTPHSAFYSLAIFVRIAVIVGQSSTELKKKNEVNSIWWVIWYPWHKVITLRILDKPCIFFTSARIPFRILFDWE